MCVASKENKKRARARSDIDKKRFADDPVKLKKKKNSVINASRPVSNTNEVFAVFHVSLARIIIIIIT